MYQNIIFFTVRNFSLGKKYAPSFKSQIVSGKVVTATACNALDLCEASKLGALAEGLHRNQSTRKVKEVLKFVLPFHSTY
jgi:hypothetical protein